MDEEILVILIAYVITPIIICTICLIAEIIRNKKRNEDSKNFLDEVSLAWLLIPFMLLAILQLLHN